MENHWKVATSSVSPDIRKLTPRRSKHRQGTGGAQGFIFPYAMEKQLQSGTHDCFPAAEKTSLCLSDLALVPHLAVNPPPIMWSPTGHQNPNHALVWEKAAYRCFTPSCLGLKSRPQTGKGHVLQLSYGASLDLAEPPFTTKGNRIHHRPSLLPYRHDASFCRGR